MSQNDAKEAGTKGSSATVMVACKLPHGLVLKLYKMLPFQEAVVGGGIRETTKAEQFGEVFKIAGYAAPAGQKPEADMVGGKYVGFALTSDVPRDFMEEWLKQNNDLPAVKNKLIFITTDRKSASDKADEFKGMGNGLEPLNMRKDAEKRPMDPRVRAISKGNSFQFGTYDAKDGL